MKTLLFYLFALTITRMSVFAQDIPSPTAKNQSLPTGSYVIAMDNTLQGTAGIINLNAYGLVTYLLNNNIRVRWVINSAKTKDGIDFSVNASRIKPTAATAALCDFRAGPFVIFASDTTGVGGLTQAFNTLSTTSAAVNVYKTTASISVDVRYDYLINGVIWKPKAALLDDGGNWDIHRDYFYAAGIRFGEVGNIATNWRLSNGLDLAVNCFTFATEAHWKDDSPNAAKQTIMNTVKQFILDGGNFLAECAAVRTYENFFKFHSSGGLDPATENDFGGASSTVVYPNPALSYSQIHGAVNIDNGGSLKNWTYLGTLQNNEHDHAKGPGTGNGPNNIGASVARIKASSPGGLVFYLGNHDFAGNDLDQKNGVRMYLNAFLTPTDPQGSLKNAAVVVCNKQPNQTIITSANVGSITNPSGAYPIVYEFYEDLGVSGPGGGDVLLSSFTATANGQGTSLPGHTLPSQSAIRNYYIKVIPSSTCFQPLYRFGSCITLPVDMISFSASRNFSMVNLKWRTSSEQNNKGFDIERQLGNGTWENVGFVKSQAFDGNSNTELSYTYNDPNSFKGISQYRLKQVDLDSRFRYSEVRSVRGTNQISKTIIYPNPSEGIVNVVFEDKNSIRDVSLYDMSGRIVNQWNGITINNLQITNLAPGLYSLRIVVRETGEQEIEKIIVNRR